jgi:hypothetical protein
MVNLFKVILVKVFEKPSLYFFIFLVIFSIDRHHRYEHRLTEISPFYMDVFEYYRILPDYFINHGKTNHAFYKTTMGMAIMYSPGFFVGHAIAKYQGVFANGYTEPYQWAIRWLSIIYALLGLWFCRKSLLYFFNEWITLISVVTVFFATNLFYYTYGWGELPHNYLFFLNALFIYLTLNWVLFKKKLLLPLLCLVGGFVTLIRPVGVIVFLFPLLFGVTNVNDLKQRIMFIFRNPPVVLLSVLMFLIPLSFQMIFWKIHTGKFLYWSYVGERFFFNDPQLVNFLFSYRKGWLTYTPVMALAVAGIAVCYKKHKEIFLAIVLIFVLAVYILSSWWEWSYGGSFGCRAMIEYYAFLIFPLAAFISWVWNLASNRVLVQNSLRSLALIIIFLCIHLNFRQTYLYRASVIHWSGMNKETFWHIMKMDSITAADYDYLNSKFTPPDQQKMLKGERDQ